MARHQWPELCINQVNDMNKTNEEGNPTGKWRHLYADGCVIVSAGEYDENGDYMGTWRHEFRDGHVLELEYPEPGLMATVYRHIAPSGVAHEFEIQLFAG